jgi:hypothetical protein
MKQRAHAWVALRALKLVHDSKQAPKLAELLSYYVSDVWDGAWLPDTLIVDMQYGHIFKMDDDSHRLGLGVSPEAFMIPERMIVTYEQLKKNLGDNCLCLEWVKGSRLLNRKYQSHRKYGGHLPNRVIAISQTISDMLKMSDYPLIFYARQKRAKAFASDLMSQEIKDLSMSPIFSPRQIALMFFILAHYITDAHMPLHCDLRDYSSSSLRQLPCGLHASIEERWELSFPEKKDLELNGYLCKSVDKVVSSLPEGSIIRIDTNDKYKLSPTIFKPDCDEWYQMVYVSRVSYAVSRKLINEPFDDADELVATKGDDFEHVTNCIFHDAVESVAELWIKAWDKFTGRSESEVDEPQAIKV